MRWRCLFLTLKERLNWLLKAYLQIGQTPEAETHQNSSYSAERANSSVAPGVVETTTSDR
jgi:hypothetical protein